MNATATFIQLASSQIAILNILTEHNVQKINILKQSSRKGHTFSATARPPIYTHITVYVIGEKISWDVNTEKNYFTSPPPKKRNEKF